MKNIKIIKIKNKLKKKQYNWLITGVAGFIGSNILEELLILNQKVTGLDNLSTGSLKNLNLVKKLLAINTGKILNSLMVTYQI